MQLEHIFPMFERSFCLDFSLSSTMSQGGHHEFTTSFCLSCSVVFLFSPESIYSGAETKFSHKPSVWIKGCKFFLKNFILPLYYAAYQAHHFLFLSVVHSCLLPPHSSCSLHHLSYPTFKEFSCLWPVSFEEQIPTSYIFLFSHLQYLKTDYFKRHSLKKLRITALEASTVFLRRFKCYWTLRHIMQFTCAACALSWLNVPSNIIMHV